MSAKCGVLRMSALQKGSGAEGGVVELGTNCACLDFHYLMLLIYFKMGLE